ncbi:Innexin [Fasciola hepatica]|uniref:Innexin n=1 Tax=Fasciola hepatica TaxID=6192 RepID=A0A4E0S0G0_FASHE|nr:Innexin [Fasciola hepatica]
MDAAFIWNLSKLGRIGSRRLQFDDDFADRLNYQYTGVLLFLFIGLIGVRQYVGKPIQCWIPQEFTRGWEEYAENYCWVANTYFAPVQDRLPPVPDRRELLLVYYQWAPIVMAAQALLFYLPCLTWRLGMAHSGFNLHRILQMAAEANEMVPETAAKTVAILSHYIKCCIQRQKACVQQNSTCCRVGTYSRLVSDAHLSHWGSGRTGNLVDKSRSSLVQKSSLTAVEEVSRANPIQPSGEDLRDSSLSVSGDEVIFGQFGAPTTARMKDSSSLGSTENGTDQHGQHPVKTKSGGTDQTGSNVSSGRARKPAPPPPSPLPVNQNTTLPLPSPETSTKKGGLSGQKHGCNTSSTSLRTETEEKNIKEKGKKSGEILINLTSAYFEAKSFPIIKAEHFCSNPSEFLKPHDGLN